MMHLIYFFASLILIGIIWFQYKEMGKLRQDIISLKSEKTEVKEEKFHLMYFLFFLIICLWIISWILIDYFIDNETTRAAFGDKFGSINSLFSGFALAGIVYTVYLQKKDLFPPKG